MPFYSPKPKTRFALRNSGNDALELGYRSIFRRILSVVLQHDVRNLLHRRFSQVELLRTGRSRPYAASIVAAFLINANGEYKYLFDKGWWYVVGGLYESDGITPLKGPLPLAKAIEIWLK